MRLSEYLQINKKLKETRTKSGITQSEMAKRLGLSNSAYSNYENGYSDPPVEILQAFCKEINITMSELIELEIVDNKRKPLETFSEIADDLIMLHEMGMSYSCHSDLKDNGELHAIFDINSSQLATMATGLIDLHEKYSSGKMYEDEFNMRLESLRQMFNVNIKDFIY